MRLKKLTLFGFKSFPNRTKIKFIRGICAIVGPNGCGKSNVVDAIRWVLGEQSAKMLRARSMDQVIFSGSNGRNVNFAEVSLLLENTVGMAPPEFEHLPEIEIKRSVTRKGDTRYLINGKNCRLKDIHYLLMDTGAGTRAYSIVDQGQVSQFVDMNPQERRHIIEEVAGISRYKARRIEAERRMADTSRNLERLNDLMSEVDRQLKSASRQAGKTQRYIELHGEQELHDKALLKYAWNEQSQRLQQLEKEMNLLNEKVAVAQAGLSALKAEKELINAGLLKKEHELKNFKTGLSGAENLLEELKKQMTDAEKEIYKTRLNLQTVEENTAQSEKKAGDAAKRYNELLETIKRLGQEKQAQKAEELEAGRYVKEAMFHVEHIRQELEVVKIELVDAAAAQARLDSERRGLKERRNRLNTRIQNREGEELALTDKISTLSTELAAIKLHHQELRKTIKYLSEREAETNRELDNIDAELNNVRKKHRDVAALLATVSAKLDALKDIETSGAGIPPEVRELLEKGQGVMGLFADFIEVERGWERIFETALGNGLHALVVDSTDTCMRLARFFGKNYPGTLSIIVAAHGDTGTKNSTNNKNTDSFNALIPQDIPSLQKKPGLDPLRDHITCAPMVVSALEGMLSDMVTCESLDECIKYLAPRTPPYPSHNTSPVPGMVTPSGEILRPWFEVNVQGQGDNSGILVRKAMIKNLEEEKERAADRLNGINIRKEALGTAEQKKRKLSTELKAGVKKAEAEFTGTKHNIDSIRMRIDSALSRKEVINFEIKEAREELMDVEFTLEERETALEESTVMNQELSASLKGREGALKQQEGVLERRRGKHQEIRIHLTRIESSLKERKRDRQRIEQQKQRIKEAELNLVMEKKRLGSSMKEQEAILTGITTKLKAQEAAVFRARSRTARLDHDRDEILQELSRFEDRIIAQEKIVHEHEKKVSHFLIDISETRQALQFINQSCMERHSISPAVIHGIDSILESLNVDAIKKKLERLKTEIDRLGPVNLGAVDEYNQLKERSDFLDTQKLDLKKSMADLRQAIDKINRTCRLRFRDALEAVNQSLCQVFPLLFDGGNAELKLEKKDEVLDAGVEYMVNLPGKKIQYLNLLSGGEKTMAAMALLFAVYFIKPSPFCLLDEVDAPLDEANTIRFNRLIKKIAKGSQVVIITHNQRVMDTADILYGVTMEDRGVSKIVSVNLISDHINQEV